MIHTIGIGVKRHARQTRQFRPKPKWGWLGVLEESTLRKIRPVLGVNHGYRLNERSIYRERSARVRQIDSLGRIEIDAKRHVDVLESAFSKVDAEQVIPLRHLCALGSLRVPGFDAVSREVVRFRNKRTNVSFPCTQRQTQPIARVRSHVHVLVRHARANDNGVRCGAVGHIRGSAIGARPILFVGLRIVVARVGVHAAFHANVNRELLAR